MQTEIKVYGCKCDNCGQRFEDDGSIGYTDPGMMIEMALDSDWIEQDEKHYCPDCYYYDENDNVILKNSETETRVFGDTVSPVGLDILSEKLKS